MRARAISHEQTLDILTGPRDIPAEVTARVESMLDEDIPVVDTDRFGEFVTALVTETPTAPDSTAATYRDITTLGSCSIEMAWQQAGDLHIPRPRRLHEHNQSVLNTFDRYFAAAFTDPRDRLLKPMFALQDGGKAHSVALATLADPSNPRKNSEQATHNHRFARNILTPLPTDILSTDEKTVTTLLIRQTAIGTALYLHSEKAVPLDNAVATAETELAHLRDRCPPTYRDRFDDYLLVSYLTDAGAHTQRAHYTDAATGETRPDVTPEDRFDPDGTESLRSLDRLFSEDQTTLTLFQPTHLAVMRRLFPDHYPPT